MYTSPERKLLKHLFNLIGLNDLPAMSAHVQELISLTNSNRSTAKELTEVILKDFSLTNKILQVANSAYYSRGVPVSSISRAVTVIGFNVVREMAMAIALFEELIKNASMKAHLTKLLTKSFVSATLARMHSSGPGKSLSIKPDEAFLCSLLYNLGEIVVIVYMPEQYREIALKVKDGLSLEKASRVVLEDLTFLKIGKEIALFWNFSQQIQDGMVAVPVKPRNAYDCEANLKIMVVFSNHLTSLICSGGKADTLVKNFGKFLNLDKTQAISMFKRSLEASEDTSEIIRNGLKAMKVREKLKKLL